MLNLRNETHQIELLFADLCITYIAGLIGCIFYQGTAHIVANLGPICAVLGIFTIFYLIGFVVWRPFNSFNRNLSTSDFLFTAGGLMTGGLLSVVSVELLARINGLVDIHDIIAQVIFSFIGIRAVRTLIRLHFHYYLRRSDSNGSYGLSDISLLNMELSDLLPRDPISIDKDSIYRFINGKKIIVTGAAGSIGSELVKKLAEYNPEVLVIIDQAETPLHELELSIKRMYPQLRYISILGDVTSRIGMEKIFRRFHPEIVFHAAAYKHVSMMEQNPSECVRNNIGGTVNIADLATENGCSKFILISSDKAVNPIGIMGCSKRICEIYCQSLMSQAKSDQCAFITTRFGNVLGSNGSVVPLFREQIRRGGPVTLTHPDVIRYFMLVSEACNLVLEAAAFGKGGEIFVFDMGAPVRIADLAKKMIRISRRSDIKIEYIGLQPGEKLYEEVLADKENVISTVHDQIKVARVRKYEHETTKKQIMQLIDAANHDDNRRVLELMQNIVTEFKGHSQA